MGMPKLKMNRSTTTFPSIRSRAYLPLLLFLLHFNCVNAQNKTIRMVVIKQMNFYILTFASINCNVFDGLGAESVNVDTIRDQKSLVELSKIVDSLKINHKGQTPDVRAKIYIWYDNGSEDTICLSLVTAELNNTPLFMDNRLIEFVEKHQNTDTLK